MAKKCFTDLKGVYGNGIEAGIKKKKKDLCLIYIPEAVGSAGVFTRNQCPAPSVEYTQKILKRNTLKAVIISSGNANAYTGKQGMTDTKRMAQIVAEALGLRPSEVAVASTGVIGVPLPMEKLESGIKKLVNDPLQKQADNAAEAILTVDLVKKMVYKQKKIGKKQIVVSGISKGSGMIAPNMATTLSYFVTNACLTNEQCQKYLKHAIEESLNMVSVDTDTSTNDMVLLFSTGESKFSMTNAEESNAFQSLLTEACIDIAKQISRDGEGAKKLIEVQVKGAASRADARIIAKQVVASPLVKTAIAAESANWGRLVMAVGKDDGVKLNQYKLDISIGSVTLVKNGEPVLKEMRQAVEEVKGDSVTIVINLNLGNGMATAWGCDMTEDFIKINAEYN